MGTIPRKIKQITDNMINTILYIINGPPIIVVRYYFSSFKVKEIQTYKVNGLNDYLGNSIA